MLKYCLYLFKANEMTKEEIILKLENQIFIAKLYGREYAIKDLEEVLTYLNKQK